MSQGIQNNAEPPGLVKNIVTDVGKAALTAASTIPGALVSQLSNQVNGIGVYLVGMPVQGIEQNENAIVAKIKELFTKLDDIDNRVGSDEDLKKIRMKITNRFVEVVGGSIDDLVNNPKLAATLNNLLDKLQRVGVNTAKVFLTAGESIILEVPGLGAVAAIVITGTKVVVAGSSVIASLLAMIQTGAIVANTSGEFVKKIAGAINEFTTSPLIKQPPLPTIGEMRENNRNVAQAVQAKGFVGGARYLKTLTQRKNNIEKRISGSIGKFMNNKLTKKRRRQKYTHKRHARR